MARKAGRKIARKKVAQKKTAKSTNAQGKKGKASRPPKIFIYTLALAALGGGGYMVYDRLRKRRSQSPVSSGSEPDTIIINNSIPASFASAARTATSASDRFPLRRGSRGTRVSLLQQALSKTSPAIAVDGQFGPQTASALKSAGYPEVIDEALFNKITSSASLTVTFNPALLASSLYAAVQQRNLEQVTAVLRQMKNTSEYASVNEYYKKQSFISRTIVTDLLDYAFKNDDGAKAQIRNEFLRMGLKVSSTGAWSLSGTPGGRLYKDLITIRETLVTDRFNNRIPVRRNTILGDELEVANGMTWFKSIDESILKVPTQDVKYS